MSELVVEPFINEFGQIINPGDEVIFAGTAWKRTTINKGVFGGVHYANVGRYRGVTDTDGNPVMEETHWGSKRQKTEYHTVREVVAVRVEKVNRGHIYEYIEDPTTGKTQYKKTEEVRYGVSTLPLKRVYKIDTSMSAFAGKSL